MAEKKQCPASCIVHWASGPLPACDKHAKALVRMGNMLGSHIAITKLEENQECSSCVNEKELEDED